MKVVPLPTALVNKIYETTAAEKVFDLYGPSEDTTYSTWVLREQNVPFGAGVALAHGLGYLPPVH